VEKEEMAWERGERRFGLVWTWPQQERMPIFELLAKGGGAELFVMWAKIVNFA